MKLHRHGFIGNENSNTNSQWSSADDYVNLTKRLEEMPIDWRYRTSKIFYDINSLGHRSKEIENLDLDNYILCTGCSHTEGIGVEEDKIYPHVLAQKLGCDYYNLGLGATGIDVVVHNLVIWFSVVPKLPKAVIIQWPDVTRTITGATPDTLHPRGLWEKDKAYDIFVNLGMKLNFFETKKLLAHHVIQSMIKVPTVYFGIDKVIPFNDDTIIEPIIDYARDLSHPGVKSHENFAESMHDYLINTLCLSFCQNPEEKS
jgi:hypothetical protein